MTWLYGDDSTWYAPDGGWSAFTGLILDEEKLTTMTVTLSPRAAAQKAVDQIKKLQVQHYEGGKWYYHAELDVVILDPPRHTFIFAFHRETLKFFRSQTRNSTRITSSSLRTIIDPERSWIVGAMKSVVPDGSDFLAFERGDQDVLNRRAAALKKIQQPARKPALAVIPETPTFSSPPAIERPVKEHFPMALLDIQKSTKRVIVEETSRILDLEGKQLVAILRSAGAPTMKKSAQIRLLAADGQELALSDGAKLRIEWTETKETEESE